MHEEEEEEAGAEEVGILQGLTRDKTFNTVNIGQRGRIVHGCIYYLPLPQLQQLHQQQQVITEDEEANAVDGSV